MKRVKLLQELLMLRFEEAARLLVYRIEPFATTWWIVSKV